MMRAAVVSAGLGSGLVQMRLITVGRTCARGYSRLTGSPIRQNGTVVTGVGFCVLCVLCVLWMRWLLERFGDDG